MEFVVSVAEQVVANCLAEGIVVVVFGSVAVAVKRRFGKNRQR